MAFPIPSLTEMRDFLRAVGKALFPDRNYDNVRSYHSKRATFLGAAVTQVHAHVDAVQRALLPSTAGDGEIDDWGGIKEVKRKGATPARKAAAGRVRGAAGTAVDAETELVHPSTGIRYKIETSTTVPAGEVVDADIVAINTGEQTRLLKGTVLEFVATPVGLDTQVVLVKDLDEDGFDREQFGAYRRRVLEAFGARSSGGNQADFVAWALELEGISQAYAYANRAGFGTVDVVGLHTGSGAARALNLAERGDLLAYLRTKAPAHLAGEGGALRVLEVVTDDQDVELVLTPDGQAVHAFDWTGGPLEVLAWTAATRTLQLTADLPGDMKAGHRLCFKGVATVQDGREFVIEAIAGADSVILQKAPDVDPAATDLVYSGGPLVTPVRNAIVAHLNGRTVYAGRGGVPLPESAVASTVGLEVLAEGIGPANPGGLYGTWLGGLLVAVIGKIAMYKGGVRNHQILSPAADYEAEDDEIPNDDQIHMIAPRAVLVRGAT